MVTALLISIAAAILFTLVDRQLRRFKRARKYILLAVAVCCITVALTLRFTQDGIPEVEALRRPIRIPLLLPQPVGSSGEVNVGRAGWALCVTGIFTMLTILMRRLSIPPEGISDTDVPKPSEAVATARSIYGHVLALIAVALLFDRVKALPSFGPVRPAPGFDLILHYLPLSLPAALSATVFGYAYMVELQVRFRYGSRFQKIQVSVANVLGFSALSFVFML